MCPPVPVSNPADIGLSTDEELIMYFEKIIRGSPLPDNVVEDVNPYQVMPSNLQDGILYFIRSEEKKYAEHGFWKAKGEACEIFTNSVITGWRTTFEFYEGQTPHGQRTDWMMQEYRITQKGLCDNSKPKDSGLLCRVFLTQRQIPDHEKVLKHGGDDFTGGNQFHSMPLTASNADSTTGEGFTHKSQENRDYDETGPVVMAERLSDSPAEILSEFDYISKGDFLELDDLADLESPSSSSDNSSRLTWTSDECFDSLELLRDLEDENQHQQVKDASLKSFGPVSIKPNEVVLHPATLGSLDSGIGSKSPAEGTQKSDNSLHGIGGEFLDKRVPEHAISSQQANNRNEGTSRSRNTVVSSGIHKVVSKGEKKALVGRMKKLKKKALVGRMKKLKKKYLCFMPF